ncbi:MAG: hypothetical protein K2W96_02565, partial [Gemmataceae bacterium]|nr:hypothetical protein [Gemmataceae bacterium]
MLCLLVFAAAPPVAPAPVAFDTYSAVIRYRIDALPAQRIAWFNQMAVSLRAAGFVRTDEPGDDEAGDRKANRLAGTLPARKVPLVAQQRHIRSLLLWPVGTALPAKDARTRVEVFLVSGYSPAYQRQAAKDASAALAKLGFQEAFGYDTEGASRLVGSLPGDSLEKALDAKDVRVVIARPDQPVPSARPAPPKIPEGQEKFSPDLRALLASGDAPRVEVLMGTPLESDRAASAMFSRIGAVVEGRLGPLVTLAGSAKALAPKAAARPEVLAVRLPSKARVGPARMGDRPARGLPVRRSG